LLHDNFIPPDHPDAMARLLAGLLAGIGFIGGGAILKKENEVEGTAAAASIWITGAIGSAVALDMFGIAIILAALNFYAVVFLGSAKRVLPDDET